MRSSGPALFDACGTHRRRYSTDDEPAHILSERFGHPDVITLNVWAHVLKTHPQVAIGGLLLRIG
jgi:hypothetical protein